MIGAPQGVNRIWLIRRATPPLTVTFDSAQMAKHLLHIGFLLAIAALALKAAFMPPRMQVALRPGESAALQNGVLALKRFSVPKYPNGKPRQYVSDVHMLSMGTVGDAGSGQPRAVHASISVNHPLRWNGWWIYQNSYDSAHESYTVLEAVRDPFLPLAALAGLLLLLGAAMCVVASAGGFQANREFCVRSRVQDGRDARSVVFTRKGFATVCKFAAATAVVMLPLWIIGKAVLAKELVPALQSPLLVPHVGAYLVSYAILIFAAFGIGVRLVSFGFFMMTLALVLGAVWGKLCWGDWWQYDPKEMWSLATWLTFAAYLHFRNNARVAQWLLRFGALMIILTLTWVNFSRIFKGLHSYV